jgi:hypothetical protein
MENNQPALRALFACELGLSEPEIGLEHSTRVRRFCDLRANEVKWHNSHGARSTKTTANCSNSFCHFHLFLSVSRPQRPLCIKMLKKLTLKTMLNPFYARAHSNGLDPTIGRLGMLFIFRTFRTFLI